MELSVVIIVKNKDRILMYNRSQNSLNKWTVLGGHLEENETIFECAEREVYEESNIHITNLRFLSVLEDFDTITKKKMISFYILADYESGELIPSRDENIDGLSWVDCDKLPKELYGPFQRFISGENLSGIVGKDIFF